MSDYGIITSPNDPCGYCGHPRSRHNGRRNCKACTEGKTHRLVCWQFRRRPVVDITTYEFRRRNTETNAKRKYRERRKGGNA